MGLFDVMGRKKKPTDEAVRDNYIAILANLIEDSDKLIYVSRASSVLNDKTNGVIVLLVVNGKIVNISKHVGSICRIRVKIGVTPIIVISREMDISNFIRVTLQRELYRDVFIKHKLNIQWV